MSSALHNRPPLLPRLITLRLGAALALAVMAYLIATCFEIALIPTRSMESTILVGDHLLVSKVLDAPRLPFTSWQLPRMHAPYRGEIVSFRSPRESSLIFLKRVVALPGDSVEMRDGVLLVNGSAEHTSYAGECRTTRTMKRTVVPQGHVFVLGDNRDNSEDSRYWGPVRIDSIVGTPVLVAWSLEGKTSDWLNRDGSLRLQFYWETGRHLLNLSRWSRIGHLVQHT